MDTHGKQAGSAMSEVQLTTDDKRTLWQRRADRVGFRVWKNRQLQDMSDAEIEAAFTALAREHRIHYIWLGDFCKSELVIS